MTALDHAALIHYDFGTVFRPVRAHAGWSQQTLGNPVGLHQTRVSAIERDVRRLRDVALVAQSPPTCGFPPVLLGFGDSGTTVGHAGGLMVEGGEWMDRRDFMQQAGALALWVAGLDELRGRIRCLTAPLP